MACALAAIAAVAVAPIGATGLPGADDVPERPNIVLILADDLGYETLGCNGGTSYSTPHLDALAAAGARFEHAYATPLCTPSRVQLMTGKYNFRNYVAFAFLRAGERTFAHLLGDAGYETCVVGKWQLCGNAKRRAQTGLTGTRPQDAGFDEHCLWQVCDVRGSRYDDPQLSVNGAAAREHPGEYGPDLFCRYAQEFITRERDGPFFLYYPMVLTHSPFHPPPGHPDHGRPAGERVGSKADYFAADVAYMDAIVGRLVATLEESGLAEDTLVLFVGDNGTDRGIVSRMGERRVAGRKGHTTAAGTHVPLVVSWPGSVPAGRARDDLVDLTDFLPTLMQAAGAELPADFQTDGVSFLPALLGPTLGTDGGSAREWVFCHYAPRWGGFRERRWVHDRRWKLYDDGSLFDLRADPRERSPIAAAGRDAPARAAAERFRAVLERHRPKPRPPNVVLILTDDQGSVDMGAYGATDLSTPAMDRLAAAGVRFTQFYAGAPVCSPSRAALLTAKSPQAAGVPGNVSPLATTGPAAGLPPEEVTLAELLRGAGYRTAHVGKWHLGHTPERSPNGQGFDYSFGHMVGCIDNYSHYFYWGGPNRHDLYRNGEEVFRPGRYFPDLMVEEASRFMRENQDRPFFLYFALNAPHYPYQGEERWLRYYDERGVAYPRNLYNAFLTSVDERIGALLDRIDALGLGEDTIVVLQSDHGHSTEVRAHSGGGSAGPYRGAKFSLFEGGIRVPAVVSWPGHLPAGEVRDQVAISADWLPTILELAGLAPAPHAIDGRSLVPLLRDAAAPSPHTVLHWQRGASWAVRRGDWKLLHAPHDTSVTSNPPPPAPEDELFLVDLTADVGERTNRATERPDLVRELERLHQEWAREWE